MKSVVAAVTTSAVLVIAGSASYTHHQPPQTQPSLALTVTAPRTTARTRGHETPRRTSAVSTEALTKVVRQTCGACHNARTKAGNLLLQEFDVATAASNAEVSEKIIAKLRAGMMPPPGRKRPGGDTLSALTETLERLVDRAAALKPEPGTRAFQRLNRAEYERSIRDLLTLDVDAGKWLPLDTKSANFDNIADAQTPSATLLDAYLDAASEVSRLAVGDPKASITSATYKQPRLASQWDQVEGAPIGTRGGMAATHNFPADGDYVFTILLHAIPTGQLFGSDAPFDEKLEVSINGERVALLDIDRWSSQADPNGLNIKTPPIPVRAGPQRVAAAFLRTFDGPVNDLIAPIGHSIADTQIGSEPGITNMPHLSDLVITGPYNPTGVSDTPSRRRIFTCRPTTPNEARPCAEKIVSRLGGEAYRRPLNANDTKALMAFYDEGAKEGGFEVGIRTALEALLASPHFVFRIEETPTAKAGARVAIADLDLASRLSFFLWGEPPDDSLIAIAKRGVLATPAGLRAQTKRMLADRRSEALATRFAAQWLRLQDIEKVAPDALQFPDFHKQLSDAMRRETELFFYSLVRENRSVLDLYNADYTYVNEALAQHYGIPGVTGPDFVRVNYPDDRRRGLLGQASVLTLTSHANRTSPVLRGKWVMEVLLGSPPPPPPPGVPDLDKTAEAKEGRLLTTRERMEMHRSNPQCRSCHLFMDPIGLALDNFDVTGQWRIRENGAALDTRGDFYDGTPVSNPAELRAALLKRPDPLIRTFTGNLMAYALGRRVEYYDGPAIRRIVNDAAPGGYKIGDIVMGVVTSDAFRAKRIPVAAASAEGDR
jgi:uracil-DNA glycosylase